MYFLYGVLVVVLVVWCTFCTCVLVYLYVYTFIATSMSVGTVFDLGAAAHEHPGALCRAGATGGPPHGFTAGYLGVRILPVQSKCPAVQTHVAKGPPCRAGANARGGFDVSPSGSCVNRRV